MGSSSGRAQPRSHRLTNRFSWPVITTPNPHLENSQRVLGNKFPAKLPLPWEIRQCRESPAKPGQCHSRPNATHQGFRSAICYSPKNKHAHYSEYNTLLDALLNASKSIFLWYRSQKCTLVLLPKNITVSCNTNPLLHLLHLFLYSDLYLRIQKVSSGRYW